mmetsp:Transcript_5553/g.8602  ORF Transcript_5553/g.8602 Transcript_5553/m.8602 type:complete len:271 (-) Transcript_5553:147-959(-)
MASRSSFFDDTPFPQSLHEKRCNSICSLLPDSLVVDMRIHVARRTAPITVFMGMVYQSKVQHSELGEVVSTPGLFISKVREHNILPVVTCESICPLLVRNIILCILNCLRHKKVMPISLSFGLFYMNPSPFQHLLHSLHFIRNGPNHVHLDRRIILLLLWLRWIFLRLILHFVFILIVIIGFKMACLFVAWLLLSGASALYGNNSFPEQFVINGRGNRVSINTLFSSTNNTIIIIISCDTILVTLSIILTNSRQSRLEDTVFVAVSKLVA